MRTLHQSKALAATDGLMILSLAAGLPGVPQVTTASMVLLPSKTCRCTLKLSAAMPFGSVTLPWPAMRRCWP
jgi:hypothetical protein